MTIAIVGTLFCMASDQFFCSSLHKRAASVISRELTSETRYLQYIIYIYYIAWYTWFLSCPESISSLKMAKIRICSATCVHCRVLIHSTFCSCAQTVSQRSHIVENSRDQANYANCLVPFGPYPTKRLDRSHLNIPFLLLVSIDASTWSHWSGCMFKIYLL